MFIISKLYLKKNISVFAEVITEIFINEISHFGH